MGCKDHDHHWIWGGKRGKILCEFCGVSLDIEMRRMNAELMSLRQANTSRVVQDWRKG